MKTSTRTVLLAGCVLTVAHFLTSAKPSYSQQGGRAATLAERVETLESVVLALEKRIRALEAGGVAQQPGQRPAGKIATFDQLDGKAVIIASDGEFLGLISSNSSDSKSIMNDVGRHGSNVASKCIFNSVGRYGSDVSTQSPWNDIASNPPKVFVEERFVGYLTTNEAKTPRIDPEALVGYLKSKE